MQTEIIAGDAAGIGRAVQILREGGIVALPTETVYGLAADALDPRAAAKIFEAKERPRFDPLIVHLPDAGWLERLTVMAPAQRTIVQRLQEPFWPGPLTFVLPRTALVPDLVTAGLGTVAVRLSAHPVLSAVAKAFGGPLAAPSANRFGRISPTEAAHVHSELEGRVPLILDGGPTAHGLESTIVAVRSGGEVEILREGPITQEDLARALGQPVAASAARSSRATSRSAGTTCLALCAADPSSPGRSRGEMAGRFPANAAGPCSGRRLRRRDSRKCAA